LLPANAVPKAKAPKITQGNQLYRTGDRTGVLTEKDKDGTVFAWSRSSQDGTSETSGERRAPIAKS